MINEQQERTRLRAGTRWVVKIGSSLITANGKGIDRDAMARWARQLAALAAQGREVLVVSSGAIAEGSARLGLAASRSIHELQAAAAVGQMGLSQAWEASFSPLGLRTALVLLTHDDLSNRKRYLNARSTLRTLLSFGVIPVINENDTVATDEIRFGDNDTLAALVCNLIEADVLMLLTDQEGLFGEDPRVNPMASLVSVARANDTALDAMAGPAGKFGRGGMQTKLRAARIASRSGASTLIGSGLREECIAELAAGSQVGTLLLADQKRMDARRRWIAGHLQTRGVLVLDAGAVRVIREQGRSLLPVGVASTRGEYARGDVVSCVDENGAEVARGLVNYSADETRRILRRSSDEIQSILGYLLEPELVHRDNMVLS